MENMSVMETNILQNFKLMLKKHHFEAPMSLGGNNINAIYDQFLTVNLSQLKERIFKKIFSHDSVAQKWPTKNSDRKLSKIFTNKYAIFEPEFHLNFDRT